MTTTVPPAVDVVFTAHSTTTEVVVEVGAEVLVDVAPGTVVVVVAPGTVGTVVAPGTVVVVGFEVVVVVRV